MKNRLSYRDFQELTIENHYPEGYGDLQNVTERNHKGAFFFGEANYRELFYRGFHIGFGDFVLNKTMQIDIECDYQTVEMKFEMSGNSLTTEGYSARFCEFLPNQHNISYINGFQGSITWGVNQNMKVFEINMSPEFFLKNLPDHDQKFVAFRKNIERRQTAMISPYNYSITPAMHWIIHDIISCRRKGVFKRLFLEAKIVELLLFQLEQMSESNPLDNQSLKRTDIEKILHVKERIESSLSTYRSLKDLAKEVGTNEFTLKKGFKKVFGTTVFGYWNQLKMNEAKTLLLDGDMSVTDVAKQLGYKNPQHFSTAFKRSYGVAPSRLKKM